MAQITKMTMNNIVPYPGEIEAAKSNPDGWVYRIEEGYSQSDRVPPEAVVGAWKVDSQGNISGDFIPNKNHKPNS